MLEVRDISKAYAHPLFTGVTFTVADGERIGVLGRNGSGKTTLFRLITGEEEPESGAIYLPKDYRCGYLAQQISFSEPTILAEAARDMPLGDGGVKALHEAQALLQGLGFTPEQWERPPAELAGGFQVRLQLARLLLTQPNLLLLDEPTNYLDIVSLRWIAAFLRSWPGGLMLISHDRDFMDSVTTHTLGIHREKVRKIRGSTVDFENLLAQEEEVHERTRLNQERRIAETTRFIERFRARASKASSVQSRIKSLARMEKLEELAAIADLDFRFRTAPFDGKWLLHVGGLSFGYEAERLLVRDLTFSMRSGDRIGVIGRNGRGKTTLLRLLAGELRSTGGEVKLSEHVQMGYFGQTNIDRLNNGNTIEQEILSVQPEASRTFVRNICGLMMFSGESALKPISVLSGGERSRVLLGKLLAEPANLLLLDEPTNHLDLQSTEALVDAADEFPGGIIVVTHSEAILRRLCDRLIVFDGPGCFVFDGGYDDFLERQGWQEEGDERKKSAPAAGNKRDTRRERAEVTQRKSRELRPLEARVNDLEDQILALEEQLDADQAELVRIAQEGYRAEAAGLARQIHDNREQVERLFEELDAAAAALAAKRREFD